MVLRPDLRQLDTFEIENWVMSCRVFGRQLEFEAMNIAVAEARRRGVKAFRANYIPTSKNRIVSELYENLGFSPLQQRNEANGTTCWVLDLADYKIRSTSISRSERTK
jgi:predicted enzyme involved in methoxymalonyl-ACP biosynthesis